MTRGTAVRQHAGLAVGVGLAVGAVAGGLEHLSLHARWPATGLVDALYALGLYGALGSLAGLGLAALWAAMGGRHPGADPAGAFTSAVSTHVSVFLLLLSGFYVNAWTRAPSVFSPWGLLLNGLLVVGVGALAVGLARSLERVDPAMRARVAGALRAWFPAFLVVPVLVLAAALGSAAVVSLRDMTAPRTAVGAEISSRPNVLILLIDALRRDHLSGYGYGRRTSPALDRLMADAVTFENAQAPSNWTVPSVASVLTGTAPATHGSLASGVPLPGDLRTLAEVLGEAGYRSGAFFVNAVMEGGGFERGFDYRYPPGKPFWCYRLLTAVERLAMRLVRGPDYNRADVMLAEVERWITDRRPRPFFAYVHLMEPHSPYVPPAPYDRLFDPAYPGPPVREPPLERAPTAHGFRDWEALGPTRAALPEMQRRNMVARYDGEIVYVDLVVGRFLDRLRRSGKYDGTLVVVTADHGEEFFEHGGWFHGSSLYDEVLGVPLIVKLPGQTRGGTRRSDPVWGVDLAPSILSILDLPVPPEMEGVDVLGPPAASGAQRAILSERPPYFYSVRQGRWKLIRRDVGGVTDLRLFDLGQDPGETANLAEARPDVLARLAPVLAARAARATALTQQPDRTGRDPYHEAQLRALGYIQ